MTRVVPVPDPKAIRCAGPVAAAVAAAAYSWRASSAFRKHRKVGRRYELNGPVSPGEAEFVRVIEMLTDAPVTRGNHLEVLFNGDETFPRMLETIRSAERTLCLLNYVYWKSDIAREVADAICRRARAGVDCRVLVDGVGSLYRSRPGIEQMAAAGVRVATFRPLTPRGLHLLDYRTHRRVIVADGRVGLTGGVGLADEWTGNAEDADSFRETQVLVRGPVVRGLVGAFAQDWLDATGEVLSGSGLLEPIPATADDAAMQLVRSSPTVRETNAEALYHFAIAAAQKSIDLTPSYLVPSAAFRQAMCHAAGRGVRVRVVVAGPNTNHVFMKYANRAAYDDLLAGGVEIFEFQPTMLHAKTMVVDDIWSSIGSINFDNRSFQLLNEATLCVQSARVAARLTAQFERDLARSGRIRADQWSRRGRGERTLELVNLVGSEL